MRDQAEHAAFQARALECSKDGRTARLRVLRSRHCRTVPSAN